MSLVDKRSPLNHAAGAVCREWQPHGCDLHPSATPKGLKHRSDGVPPLSPAVTVSEKAARKRWARRFLFMKSSTKDKIKGSVREAKGKVKEESGKAIGNPNLRDRGTGEKVAGKIQKRWAT